MLLPKHQEERDSRSVVLSGSVAGAEDMESIFSLPASKYLMFLPSDHAKHLVLLREA